MLEDILVPVGICVVLPVMCVWLSMRSRINRDNANKDVLLAAIEKNSELDVEKFMDKLSPKRKLLKEKLLSKLLWAVLSLMAGIAVLVSGSIIKAEAGGNDFILFFLIGGAALAIGIAFMVNFFVGRRMLAKEIEAEEKLKTQK